MWLIQTSVEALALPTDSVGRTTLMGTSLSWQHLVRDHTFTASDRAAICAMPVRWSIWPWQPFGRRVQVHDAIAVHEPLVTMVRADPIRACAYARFPEPGQRQADRTIEVIVVVPPEQFSRYEALVQFAMTLPSGHVALTVRTPALDMQEGATGTQRRLIAPGDSCLLEGLELVVARATAHKFGQADLKGERRTPPDVHKPAQLLYDDGDDWLLFRASTVGASSALKL